MAPNLRWRHLDHRGSCLLRSHQLQQPQQPQRPELLGVWPGPGLEDDLVLKVQGEVRLFALLVGELKAIAAAVFDGDWQTAVAPKFLVL